MNIVVMEQLQQHDLLFLWMTARRLVQAVQTGKK